MPMKWTPENDQLLLLKILETHELSVDTKKVAQAWPAEEGQDKPTPRAITERLVRMRQIVKSSGNLDGHFSIGKGNGVNSASSTPRKSRKINAATPSTPGSAKRKRAAKSDHSNELDLEEDDYLGSAVKMAVEGAIETPTPTKKPLHPTMAGMNQSNVQIPTGSSLKLDSANGGHYPFKATTPTKRTRRASTLAPGMVSYTADMEDRVDDVESSASEYLPDDPIKMEDDPDAEYA